MKCGTTSLRHLLAAHPRVFMPAREIFLFAIDDLEQHPGALYSGDGRWILHDYDGDRERYVRWYARFFENAVDGQIVGEGSTSYMSSSKAPRRIVELLPHAKLVFMLRDPVDRAYSQYWHVVRAGGATQSFEETLKRAPASLLQRSCYGAQVERFTRLFPRDQLKFVIFEEFIGNSTSVAREVAGFVGVHDPELIPDDVTSSNPARMPRSLGLQLLRNRWLGPRGARDRFRGLGTPMGIPRNRRRIKAVLDGLFERVNPLARVKPPPMKRDTRAFLTALMQRENRGLSDLIGIDVERYWYRKSQTER